MFEKIRSIIAEQLCLDENEITEDTNLKEDLGADSLDLFEIVMALEDEFDMEISEESVMDLTTISDVIEYLRNKGIE